MILFILSPIIVLSQNVSLTGVKLGDKWTLEITENTMLDKYGKIEEYHIANIPQGVVYVGDTFDFEITTEIAEDSSYRFSFYNGNITAVGTRYLNEFGSEIVYTDWEYWRENAKDASIFRGGIFLDDTNATSKVTVDENDSEFSAVAEFVEPDGEHYLTLSIVYFKKTGIFKTVELYFSTKIPQKFILTNISGSRPEKYYDNFIFYGLIFIISSIIVLLIIRKKYGLKFLKN